MQLIGEALTFDDVSLQPAYSERLPGDVELRSRLTRDISINAPLASAAMDTVTEARLAIAMAQEGGIGVIHKNMTLQQQAEQVLNVPARVDQGHAELGIRRLLLLALAARVGSDLNPRQHIDKRANACGVHRRDVLQVEHEPQRAVVQDRVQ